MSYLQLDMATMIFHGHKFYSQDDSLDENLMIELILSHCYRVAIVWFYFQLTIVAIPKPKPASE